MKDGVIRKQRLQPGHVFELKYFVPGLDGGFDHDGFSGNVGV
jgi:hypothetical protein